MNTQNKQNECPRCLVQAKLRQRDFSSQAYSALLAWGEIEKEAVGLPICDDCYSELREVLVDRADDLVAISDSKAVSETARAG